MYYRVEVVDANNIRIFFILAVYVEALNHESCVIADFTVAAVCTHQNAEQKARTSAMKLGYSPLLVLSVCVCTGIVSTCMGRRCV